MSSTAPAQAHHSEIPRFLFVDYFKCRLSSFEKRNPRGVENVNPLLFVYHFFIRSALTMEQQSKDELIETKSQTDVRFFRIYVLAVLKEYLDFAITLARDAGAIIKGALDTRMKGGQANILLKYDNPSDLVTETDQAVEKFIKERLFTTYPTHK